MRYYFLLLLIVSISCAEENSPPDEHLFTSLSPSESGIYFQNKLVENNRFNYLFYQSIYNGGGVALSDLDNDGLLDIYLCGNQVPNALYRNLGAGKFEDVSKAAGVDDNTGWSAGVCAADFNADGLTDLYVSRFLLEDPRARENLLYINKGDMRFEENAEQWGLADSGYSVQAYPLDFDRDGDMDLYLVNQPPNFSKKRMDAAQSQDFTYTDKLYRNEGDHFTDISESAGLLNMAYGLSAMCSDINDDGWVDIYVANDFDVPDQLFINQKDGTFTEEASMRLGHMSTFSMGSDVADINNDGLMDLFVADMVAEDNKRVKTNMSGMDRRKFQKLTDSTGNRQYMFNSLQLNRGGGLFSEIAHLSGVSNTDWSWSPLIADFDNDGLKDLLVTNGLKRDIRDNDFNISRRKKIRELQSEAHRKGKEKIDVNPIGILDMAPQSSISNYLFQNKNGLTFENVTKIWGLSQQLTSQGAAYGDIDNDGDLDLVLNNLDATASIYLNNSSENLNNHHFQAEIIGKQSLSCRMTLYCSGESFTQESQNVRGFQSTSTRILHFGIGSHERVDSIWINWSTGKSKRLGEHEADRTIEIHPNQGSNLHSIENDAPLFSQANLFSHRHVENDFDDFDSEVLLPHRMSTLGPFISVSDIDGNGLDDVFIGGARGEKSTFLFQFSEGFEKRKLQDSEPYEDMGSTFFDFDNDGDLDLYVVSGGNEERFHMEEYSDRLYLNDGNGNFSRSNSTLPVDTTSGSFVLHHDYDSDGDLDLFIGGRQIPGRYPYSPKSRLLVNENGQFEDRTTELAPSLEWSGMLTDGQWTDLDGDGIKELVCVGEWCPIRFYKVRPNGGIELWKELPHSAGWWQSVLAEDLDGDGDIDIAAGNLGRNIKYRASEASPFEIFSKDFDDNGSNDIYLGYHQNGTCYPVRGRECSSEQMPYIKDRFPTYNQFSEASIYDVLSTDTVGALHYRTEIFESSIIWNQSDGFVLEPMCIEAQFSEVNCMLYHDFDKDGTADLLLAGNRFDREAETSCSDASFGILLSTNEAGFQPIEPRISGLWIGGDVRDVAILKCKKKDLIIATRNSDQVLSLIEN